MITRQKIILDLIKRAGRNITRLHLMKLAFLLAKEESELESFYDFVPYHYGPFSFTLYHELDTLISEELIKAPNSRDLRPTENVQYQEFTAPGKIKQKLAKFWLKYGSLKTAPLIETVYAQYPWYTLNSRQKERRKALRPVAVPAVYTAGYEGVPVDGLLNNFLLAGIEEVVDVRSNPVARRYGFHKSTFSKLCNNVGLEYFHLPELGIPSTWRTDLHELADYDRVFIRYRTEILQREGGAIQTLERIMTAGSAVLMCKEADPAYCHRSHLAELIAQEVSLPVNNLVFTQ